VKIFFETESLYLRPPRREDFETLFELQTDKAVMEFIGDGAICTADKVRAKLDKDIAHFDKHGFGTGLVFEKSSAEFVGLGGLTYLEYDDTQELIELDCLFHKAFWGKGYAAEIVNGALQWGFQHLAVSRLTAVIDVNNIRSQKLVLKCGLKYVKDSWCYGKTVKFYEIEREYFVERSAI